MTVRDLPEVQDVVRLVSEVVGVAPLSPESNFFDVGGDSLTAARLAVLMEERWEVSVDVFGVTHRGSVGVSAGRHTHMHVSRR